MFVEGLEEPTFADSTTVQHHNMVLKKSASSQRPMQHNYEASSSSEEVEENSQYLRRLASQIERLLHDDEEMFEFILGETFDGYFSEAEAIKTIRDRRSLSFMHLAPLIENLLKTQGKEPSYQAVYSVWKDVRGDGRSDSASGGEQMGYVSFLKFIKSMLGELVKCINRQQAELNFYSNIHPPPPHGNNMNQHVDNTISGLSRITESETAVFRMNNIDNAHGGFGGGQNEQQLNTNFNGGGQRQERFDDSPQYKSGQHHGMQQNAGGFPLVNSLNSSIDLESLTGEISRRSSKHQMMKNAKRPGFGSSTQNGRLPSESSNPKQQKALDPNASFARQTGESRSDRRGRGESSPNKTGVRKSKSPNGFPETCRFFENFELDENTTKNNLRLLRILQNWSSKLHSEQKRAEAKS